MSCKRFARGILSYVFGDVLERRMNTNDEVRRRRLARLCKDIDGGLIAVAENAGLSPAYLDQIMKRVLLPERADGTRSARALSDQAARQIEVAHGVTPGWLDWPLEAVDFEDYSALSDLDKGAVQARMMAAIEDRLQNSAYEGVPDNIDRKGMHLSVSSNQPPKIGESGPVYGPALTKAFEAGKGVRNAGGKSGGVSKPRGNKRS